MVKIVWQMVWKKQLIKLITGSHSSVSLPRQHQPEQQYHVGWGC
jgi:hypothetical protein